MRSASTPGQVGAEGIKAKERGVIKPQRQRKDIPYDPFKHLRTRPAVLGRILQQLVFEPLPELSVPGIFSGQALDPLHQKLPALRARSSMSSGAI